MTYTIDKSKQKDILAHFNECNQDFIEDLKKKVNLEDYATKIFDRATRFEYWKDDKLAGLIAMYFNRKGLESFGYITHVGVISTEQRKGIASSLLSNCIYYASKEAINQIDLEVNKYNEKAIRVYRNFDFKDVREEGNSLFMRRIEK